MKNIFKKNRKAFTSYLIVILVYILITVLNSTGNLSQTMNALLIPTCAYIVAALALNLLVGYLGDLCLGQAGFMAVGAFTGVVCAGCLIRSGVSEVLALIISIIVGGLFSSIFGLIVGIPVLKLDGDYLAIVTLAFCQIIKTIFLNLYVGVDDAGLHLSFVSDTTNLASDGQLIIKGALGAAVSDKLSGFLSGVILILFTLFIIYNLINSKTGRAIEACHDNKIAATSLGVNITKYKLMAFVISAFLTGMAGAYYGLGYSSFKATKFDFNLSILILVYVVLGGLGNMTGTMISTTLLIVLPEALRSFNDYRMIVYAIVLILVMILSNNKKLMGYVELYKNNIVKFFKSLFKKKGVDHEWVCIRS